MAIIALKDKVLSHEQFSSLQYAINGLFASGRYHADQIQKFNATPILYGPKFGFYKDIFFEADDDIADPLRAVLQAFGFIERPAIPDANLSLSTNPQISSQVKSYAEQAKLSSSEKIDWAIWYDLNDTKDVWLLYIAEEISPSEDGTLDTYQFTPGTDVRIPGKILITLTSLAELQVAYQLKPNQKAIMCLQSGDFSILFGPPLARLGDALPWIHKEIQNREIA